MEFKNKREHVTYLIEQGTYNRDQIVAEAGVTEKSFGSICSTLRLMGKYPHKNEDGTWKFISQEEYETIVADREANRGEKAEPLTPEQRLERAQKNESKASAKLTNAKARFEKDASRENELALKIAEMELELCSIRLSKVEQEVGMIAPHTPSSDQAEEVVAETAPSDEPW